MPNHYHLVGEFPPPGKLSKIIGACQQIYAAYYHRKYQTAGRLFQNRFKSQAIEKERYLLSCGRYAELNPVRAKLVKYPWDWKWSSAGYYVNGINDDITTADPEWRDKDAATYKRWLSDWEAAEKEREIFFSSNNIIGSQEFKRIFTIEEGRAKPMLRGKCRENAGREDRYNRCLSCN
jgi:putative transposase